MAKMTVTRSFNGNLDASFSTYLNLKPNHESNTATAHHAHAHLGCAVDDCEISIFDAQKYFNEGNNNTDHQIKDTKRVPLTRVSLGGISELPRFSSASSADTYSRNNYRVGGRSFHATPTASSEASWNSQTGLLSNPPGSMKVSLRNVPTAQIHEKKTKSRASWFFRRRCPCPCTGGKSILVEEKLAEPRTPARSDISSNTQKHTLKSSSSSSVEKVAVVEKTANKSDRGGEDEVVTNPRIVEVVTNQRSVEVVTNSPPKFSAENRFPESQGHRIMATGRSFSDNAAGFSFPILNHPMKLALPPPTNHHPGGGSEDPPRESLEVFRPFEDIEPTSRNSSLDLHHRDRRSFTFPASPRSRMTTVTDDDVASDASSDLFEIESFSTQTTTTTCPVLYRRRDSLEDEDTSTSSMLLRRRLSAATIGGGGGGGGSYYPTTPSIAATECYEPSEASIDWSVTTAEGLDRASLTNYSFANGSSLEVPVVDEEAIIRQHEQENNRRKGGWNGLLSCRCKKAVGVGPNVVKTTTSSNVVVNMNVNDHPYQQQGGGGHHQHHQHHHHHLHDQAAAAATVTGSCTVVNNNNNNKHVSSRPPPPQLATSHSHSARLFLPFAT